MTLNADKEDTVERALRFVDKALLMAESIGEEEALAGGILAAEAVSMAMAVAEGAVDNVKRGCARCEVAIGLLRLRGAANSLTCASLKADLTAVRARFLAENAVLER